MSKKTGSKNSKTPAFEEINFTLFNDNDKTVSFFTSEESLPFWINSLKEYYESKVKENATVDIEWGHVLCHRKIKAQVKENCNNNKDGAPLTISFYYTTFRVLLQGNSCNAWCTDVFPIIKEIVQRKRNNNEVNDLESILAQLNGDDGRHEQVQDGANDKTPAPETSVSKTCSEIPNSPQANAENITKQSTLSPKTPKTPRRQLPTTPAKENINGSLLKGIDKLQQENVHLKEKIHDITVEHEKLNTEFNEQKQTISTLQCDISKLKDMFNTDRKYESLSFQLDVMNTEINKNYLQLQDKCRELLTKETEDIFTRLRELHSLSVDNKENVSTMNNSYQNCSQRVDNLEQTIKDIFEEMNKVQEHLFNEETVTNENQYVETAETTPSCTQTVVPKALVVNLVPTNSQSSNKPPPDSSSTQQQDKIFRDMKGHALLFGDSNTKGLHPKKLNMRIGSLSGASIDSAIQHMETSKEKDENTDTVIYHLGTNNLLKDDTDTLKQKVDSLLQLAAAKYPKAKIGMCKIPRRQDVSQEKIDTLNNYISQHKDNNYIDNNITERNFVKDKLHYNKRGLALLAASLKSWKQSINPEYDYNNYHYNSRNPDRYETRPKQQERYGGQEKPYSHHSYYNEDNYRPKQQQSYGGQEKPYSYNRYRNEDNYRYHNDVNLMPSRDYYDYHHDYDNKGYRNHDYRNHFYNQRVDYSNRSDIYLPKNRFRDNNYPNYRIYPQRYD